MDRTQPKIVACGAKAGAKGIVKLVFKVLPNGDARIQVTETPEESLGKCVAKEAGRAQFPKSQKGVTFSQPFVC